MILIYHPQLHIQASVYQYEFMGTRIKSVDLSTQEKSTKFAIKRNTQTDSGQTTMMILLMTTIIIPSIHHYSRRNSLEFGLILLWLQVSFVVVLQLLLRFCLLNLVLPRRNIQMKVPKTTWN